jgi:hypothetical protein
MLCPFCNAFRPANNTPCPQCKAPSPLAEKVGGQNQVSPPAASWGGPITPASSNGWGNQMTQGSLQGGMNDNALWGQVMAPQPMSVPAQQQYPSILPVQYQGGIGVPQQAAKVTSSNLPVIHNGSENASMMPAVTGEEGPIHVPAMYTKPRAIIPPYRAISGLISVIIVSIMLCTGAGFYAKASGKLAFLHLVYGDAKPDNIKTAQSSTLPIPLAMPTFGSASQIINSATTASQIDQAAAQPRVPTNKFKVGDTIFLTYSVHPKSPGVVTARWFTNNNFYLMSMSAPIKEASSGYFPMQYLQPAEGKVELYWNGQFAVALFFVVEPGQS